MKGDLSHFNIK